MRSNAYSFRWIALILGFPAAIVLGADTRPSTKPAPIDQVVNIPPISLKTKGVMPIDAFKMLEQATGIKIVPAQADSDGGANFHTHPINLWADRTYPKIDFDLETVSFWQAMDRLTAKADLDVSGGDRWITLYPHYVSSKDRGWDYAIENPMFLAYAQNAWPAEFHFSELWFGQAKSADYAEVPIKFDVDPRIRICEFGQPVIETAQDETNRSLSTKPIDPISQDWSLEWSDDVRISIKRLPGSKRIATLRGYVPVQIVIAAKDVEVPIVIGRKVIAGPWTIELTNIRRVGGNAGTETLLGIDVKRGDKDAPAVPADFRELVQLRDSDGVPLVPSLFFVPKPSATPTGGISEQLGFAWCRWDGNAAEPAKLVVAVPTEIREAALSFEFKDVQLP